jgi:hypothetical protein
LTCQPIIFFVYLSRYAAMKNPLTIFAFLFIAIFFTVPARAGFIYDPISQPIISASFNADFAALVAHRTIAGEQVNMVSLMGSDGTMLDLSDAFYGTSELLNGDIPQINQGPLETGIFSAEIPNTFFSVLQTGKVGIWFLATDTDDGLFAIDFLSLKITTASATTESFIASNDGFGIGLTDGGILSDPLPVSIPIGATGIGFDEAVSSKTHHNVVPEPALNVLLSIGLVMLLVHKVWPIPKLFLRSLLVLLISGFSSTSPAGDNDLQFFFSVDRIPQVGAPQTAWAFGDPNPLLNEVHDDFLLLNLDQSSQVYRHDYATPDGTNDVAIPASLLGLAAPPLDAFNLDGLSRNHTIIPGNVVTNVFFSVEDRQDVTEGAIDTQLNLDSLLRYTTDSAATPPGPAVPGDGSTAGNLYYIVTQDPVCAGLNLSAPSLRETTLGLKPDMAVAQSNVVQDEDNLDAVQFKSQLDTAWAPYVPPPSSETVYFSIATDSANIPVFTPAAIWVSERSGSFDPFASAESMGLIATTMLGSNLVVGDDLDAVSVFDAGVPGVMEPGIDKALFSVRPQGPSELDPGTVFFTDFTGSYQIAGPTNIPVTDPLLTWLKYPLLAANLGLNSGDSNSDGKIRTADGEITDNFDNVDALDEVHMTLPRPPPIWPPVPPPPPIWPPVPPPNPPVPPGVTILMLDFGDNPVSYGPAAHQTVGLEMMGTFIDLENTNQPSANSDADDLNPGIPVINCGLGPDDEDGVVFTANSAIVTVNTRRTEPYNYRIDAYFDTNRNGFYDEPPFVNMFTLPGSPPGVCLPIVRTIFTPFNPTDYQSRFRLTSRLVPAIPPQSPPVGRVPNGEVEDYPGTLPLLAAADQLHIVGPNPNQIPSGGQGTIMVSVQAHFNGLPNKEVVLTKVIGNFSFTGGTVSPDGKKTKLTTGSDGTASVGITANGVGKSLVKATATGTPLTAYSYFVIN